MEKIASNRSFGIVFFVLFLLIGLWPLLNGETIRVWSISVSLFFLILGIFNSRLLIPLKIVWIKLGEILGRFVAPIVMAIIYFIILTPTGLLMRLIGKDFLNTKFSKNNSYWIKREKNIGSMKRQF